MSLRFTPCTCTQARPKGVFVSKRCAMLALLRDYILLRVHKYYCTHVVFVILPGRVTMYYSIQFVHELTWYLSSGSKAGRMAGVVRKKQNTKSNAVMKDNDANALHKGFSAELVTISYNSTFLSPRGEAIGGSKSPLSKIYKKKRRIRENRAWIELPHLSKRVADPNKKETRPKLSVEPKTKLISKIDYIGTFSSSSPRCSFFLRRDCLALSRFLARRFCRRSSCFRPIKHRRIVALDQPQRPRPKLTASRNRMYIFPELSITPIVQGEM